MSMDSDPLTEAWAKKVTREVASLLLREKGANRVVNQIRADIGDRCVTMKQRLRHGEFLNWCAATISPDRRRVQEYLSVAAFRAANVRTFGHFAEFNPCKLMRIAALPPALASTLTPDTRLPIPGTDLVLRISEMGYLKLDRALDALEGKKAVPKEKKTLAALLAQLEDLALQDPKGLESQRDRLQAIAGCPRETMPDTKEGRAAAVTQSTKKLLQTIALVNGGVGALSAAARQGQVDLWEDGRRHILRWKAPGPAGIRRRAPMRPGP